ncbi:DUF6876 family protein [Methylobacter sp. YRD-M1]|uniref:DUF6876 family protein n=1 Tax=Methylobacter sp. YRD-M1 TaxID=2911520 RepID=UPI00227CE80F|nr:DUF6876 family protein [Methylobacter sp. YRD-M1]WAK01839.1 hypothetical protein LZ558_18800 [Methylobacter sp. YRD-M1]
MNITPADLTGFHGTANYFKTLTKYLVYTDGVQYFARNGGNDGAYWFIDFVNFSILPELANEEFLLVKITVVNNTAVIAADDGNDHVLFEEKIEYTDLADGEWRFYIEDGYIGESPVKVLMLPSER